jgi:hypothetical protein
LRTKSINCVWGLDLLERVDAGADADADFDAVADADDFGADEVDVSARPFLRVSALRGAGSSPPLSLPLPLSYRLLGADFILPRSFPRSLPPRSFPRSPILRELIGNYAIGIYMVVIISQYVVY